MRRLRSSRPPGPSRAAALLAAAFALGGLGGCTAGPSGAPSRAPAPPAAAAQPRGSLFSAIPCAETPLGRVWARIRSDAAARFPDLRLSRVEDLHVTVVYVGAEWKTDDLEAIRTHALVSPRETVSLRPEVVRMGREGQVVAVELHGAPEAWAASVVAAKAELNRLGLKKADRYDADFRPHVTLASSARSTPDAAESAKLDALRAWIGEKIAEEPKRFALTVGPGTPIRLWLAGTKVPPGAPEYVDVESVVPRR